MATAVRPRRGDGAAVNITTPLLFFGGVFIGAAMTARVIQGEMEPEDWMILVAGIINLVGAALLA